jgi:hypothetical protein
MAMMTVRKRAVFGSAMVARNAQARKRPRPKKRLQGGVRGLGIDDDQVECRCDDATCLARQAGPGPRM